MSDDSASSAPKSALRLRRFARPLAAMIIVSLCGVYVVRHALELRDKLADSPTVVIDWRLAAAIAAFMGGQLAVGIVSKLCLGLAGANLRVGRVLRIYLVAQALKYLPAGNLLNVTAQTYSLGRLPGANNWQSLQAIATMMMLLVGAAASWFGITDWLVGARQWWSLPLIIALPTAALASLLLRPLLTHERLRRLLRSVGPPDDAPSISLTAMARAAMLASLAWIFFGLSLTAVVSAYARLDAALVLQLIGIFAISWAAGFVTFVVPAGIGVRDVTLLALLATLITPPWPFVITVVSRIVSLLADLLNLLFAQMLLRGKARNGKGASQS